jgi:hypothetical protein
MHWLFRSIEHSHVKTNIVHRLHRVKAFGSQPLESFKDMLTANEYRKCEANPQIGKSWYSLTTDVFISFLFRVSDILASIRSALHISSNYFDVFLSFVCSKRFRRPLMMLPESTMRKLLSRRGPVRESQRR